MKRIWVTVVSLALVGCGSGKSAEDSGPPATTTSTGGSTIAQAPNAQSDLASVAEGDSVSVDVAANDLVTTNPLDRSSVAIENPPSKGTAAVQADGTVLYTHDGSEGPSDSFTYTVADSAGTVSAAASVQVTVTPVNDIPVAVDDAGAATQGATLVLNLLANDSDADDGLDTGGITIATAPAHASIVDNGDGTVDYVHDGSSEAADSFTYTVDDLSGATSNTATVTLTVAVTNAVPVAVEDTLIVVEGGSANVNLPANDSDADDGLDLTSVELVSLPTAGVATVLVDGSVDYTHDGTELAADSFSYRIFDNAGSPSNTAFVQVLISPVNDAPVAADDSVVVGENATANAVVLANDTDVDSALVPGSVVIVSAPLFGTATPLPNGTIDYSHDGSQVALDGFTYTVADGAGAVSNEAAVDVLISLYNDATTAVDDAATVAEGGAQTLDLAANDSDSDDGLDLDSITLTGLAANGTVQLNGDGTVLYTHDGSEGAADSFRYTIDDLGGGTSAEATVRLTVTPVNDLPVAVDDAAVALEGGSVLIPVTGNDVDPDDGVDPSSVFVISGPSNGSLVPGVVPGTWSYQHNGSETLTDSFEYEVSDFAGATSNLATVALTITPVNDAPVAVNDSGFAVDRGGRINIAVLPNDSDVDSAIDAGSVAVSSPTNGIAYPLGDGTVDFQHDGSNTLTASFSYQVSDVAGASSNTALVSITINPVATPPTAVDDYAGTVQQGELRNFDVAGNVNVGDAPLDYGSIQIVDAPLRGELYIPGDGTVFYTHDGTGETSDGFTYTMDDLDGLTTNVASITFDIVARPNEGDLYVVRQTDDMLLHIDPETEIATVVGPLGVDFSFGDLTWHARTNQLFMVGGIGLNNLYTVNRTTGAATFVGAHGLGNMWGLTSDGFELYGEANGQLYALDPATAVASAAIGAIPSGSSLLFDTRRDELLGAHYSGNVNRIDRYTAALVDLAVPSPIYMNNSGSAYDSSLDVIWTVGVNGDMSHHYPVLGYTQVLIGTGLGYIDGMAYVPRAGAHKSSAFTAELGSDWRCSGADANYTDYGLLTFAACENLANSTGQQWFTGASSPVQGGWIGGHDTANATIAGYSWPTEELRPKTVSAPCVLADLEDYGIAPPSPEPQTYTDLATGRTWHFWDFTQVLAEDAIAFARARGARIINPNSVGMTGAVRGTAPTHWCFASALYNAPGDCNTNVPCDYVVGYFE